MKMIEASVCDLEGFALDWAVAKCQNLRVYITPLGIVDADLVDMNVDGPTSYSPSTLWFQGGPILDKQEITVDYRDSQTEARIWSPEKVDFFEAVAGKRQGLLAAMRCYVMSVHGETIYIPEILEKKDGHSH